MTTSLQLQITAQSNPPAPPTDVLTGAPPAAFFCGDYAISIGVFNPDGSPFDFTGFDYLSFEVRGSAAQTQNPPLFSATVLAEDITDTIQSSQWLSGFASNAVFAVNLNPFLFANCEWQPDGNQQSTQVWITIRGYIASGNLNPIIAGFWATLWNSGLTPVLIPSYPPPTLVPAGTAWYVPPGTQAVIALPLEIDGTAIIDGALVETP